MKKNISVFFLISFLFLFFTGCSQPKEPVSTPNEKAEVSLPQEEKKEDPTSQEKTFSSPEEISGKLALEHAGEGRITSIKTKEYQSTPVMEVHVQKEKELLVYLINPETKVIESVLSKEQEDPGISLEEGHFLAREFVGGKTELREIQVEKDGILYTFKTGKGGERVKVDHFTKKVERLNSIDEIFELKGEVYIDLFQAIQKIEVNYGKVDLQSVAYVPQSEERSAIELRVFFKENEPEVLRTMRLDTYTGVVYEQDF